MSSKKEFNDTNRSYLSEIYTDIQAIVDKKPCIQLFDQTFSAADIEGAIREQPVIAAVAKNAILDVDAMPDATNAFKGAIKQIPKIVETVVMESICVQSLPGIEFFGSEMKTVKGKARLMPPRMIIDLTKYADEIKPFHGVRINTGYIFRLPTMCMGATLQNESVVNTTMQKQIEVIIVPTILSQHDGIIQSIYARDPDDTGLMTINFTTTSNFDFGKMKNKTMQIVFDAYKTIQPMNMVNVVDMKDGQARVSTDIGVFKTKDSKSGRLVKNPKIKYVANEFDLTTVPKSLLLGTHDTSSPMSRIKIDNVITFFSSRKREWCNPDVVSFAGIYNPSFVSENGCASPVLADGSKSLHNTHCMTFVTGKVVLFSRAGNIKSGENVRYINGSFYNLGEYDSINKSCRQMAECITKMSQGARLAMRLMNEKHDAMELMKIYDYHRTLNAEKLDELLTKTDIELFNSRPMDVGTCTSVILKSMKNLVYIFCSKKFTTDQLNELSVICGLANKNDAEKAEKRPHDNEDTATATVDTTVAIVSDNGDDCSSPKRSKIE